MSDKAAGASAPADDAAQLRGEPEKLMTEAAEEVKQIPYRVKEYRALKPGTYLSGVVKFKYGFDGECYHFDIIYQQKRNVKCEDGSCVCELWYAENDFSEHTKLTPERLEALSKSPTANKAGLFAGRNEYSHGLWTPNSVVMGFPPEYRDIFLNDLECFKPVLKEEWEHSNAKLMKQSEKHTGKVTE